MTRKLVAAAVLAVAALAAPTAAAASADAVIKTSPCPPGDTGVVVATAGRELVVCTNI